VLFFNQDTSPFKYIRKQGMQLASKMRYIAAQFNAYLADDLWLRNAQHANEMANLLSTLVKGIPGVKLTRPTMANGVFAIIPREIIEPLQEKYFFYVWNEATNEVRWMTSYDTTEEDVRGFVATIHELINFQSVN
jgi:threonine aldolase